MFHVQVLGLGLGLAYCGLDSKSANDTQVYISTPAGDAEAAVRRLTACLVDIEARLKASRLRLNPMWCGWVLHNSWRKSTFRRFQWRRHVSTSRRRPLTSASSSTASWRCLCRWLPCVAVATTSYGSSDRSSDRCHLTPLRRYSPGVYYCNSMFYGMMSQLQSVQGPRLWNNLPAYLRQTDISFEQFKRLLKTFLFGRWERGTLWLTVKSRHWNQLTYLLTVIRFQIGPTAFWIQMS